MEDTHKPATSNKTDPSKYYTNFLYKAAIASVFLLILPNLPSQSPEFVTQNRTWELFQLLFVGVVVSYGLFSRKNDETENEHGTKFDNAHTYLSRFLQISPVFDEETEFPIGFDESKIQTWNNQYCREEPVLVVAQKGSVFENQSRVNSVSAEKPLLLPIRSLKSRVSEPGTTIELSEKGVNHTRSNSSSSSESGSRRFSSDSGNIEQGGIDFSLNSLGVKLEENVVLRSPIPWRSRSGRMEVREDIESFPPFSLDSETEYSVSEPLKFPSSRPQFSHPSKPNSRKVEDLARRKIYHKTKTPPPAPPPPPPPPLPPRYHQKSPLGKSSFVPVKAKTRKIEESESDEEKESDEIKEGKEEEITSNGESESGPDVNKKADEFIAKFREQIRLQKIESIKQIGRNSTR